MGKVLFLLCLVVVAVAAGQFERSALAFRMRRHASMRCCNDGFETSEIHAKFEEIRQGCLQDLGLEGVPDEEIHKNREHLNCITECIVKKEAIAEENGALVHTDLAKVVQEHMSTIEWKVPLVDGFVKQCFDMVDEAHKDFQPSEEAKCNPEGFEFVFCLWRQFALSCPEEFRDNSERCTELREKLTNNENIGAWRSDVDEA
ncbi:uncharacterized protein LOC125954348 [Anopheles darlingi]|uniref:uncharacterized protein LOC125954348 n=1 Tax=Anopheles darlingi TaxID=43151 RepID=UPI0020FFFE5E|nr:uncharacterized protein LOC125954348 [Anopheles darlingi]